MAASGGRGLHQELSLSSSTWPLSGDLCSVLSPAVSVVVFPMRSSAG